MGGVVALGECMVEVSLEDAGRAAIGYAGDVFNTAVYLRRLGHTVAFASALGGDDPFTATILKHMAAERISTDLVTRVEGRLPGLYAIQRDQAGERRFFYWREQAPVRQLFELADVERLTTALRQTDLFYISGITLAILGEAGRSALGRILAELAAAGVAVAFDPNYRARLWPSPEAARVAIEAVIPHCRIVLVSSPDVEDLYGRPLAEVAAGWARRGPQVVARAEDHSVAIHLPEGVTRLPPLAALAAVDTTGAGDSFNAGYLAGWLAGEGPESAVAMGRRLAAAVVGHVGAIIPHAAMPDRAQ